MASESEVRLITNLLHIAEAMANDRGWVIALTDELRCKPQQFCRRVDILEIVRPKHLLVTQKNLLAS